MYVPFAVLTMFGPLPIMLLQHDRIHLHPLGLAFVALLLLALARGSITSWTLLLVWNVFLMFTAAPGLSHPGAMTADAPLLPLLGLSCAVMQLRPSMRQHVGFGRSEDAARRPATPH